MQNYILFLVHRFLLTAAMLLILPAVIYAIVNTAPDNPSFSEQGFGANTDQSYSDWLSDALSGNFGNSVRTRQPIGDLLSDRLSASLEILIPALLLSLAIGTLLGAVMAGFARGIPDALLRFFTLSLAAYPIYALALMLVLQWGIQSEVFPLGGRCPVTLGECTFADRIDYLVLPISSFTVGGVGMVALFVRRFTLNLRAANKGFIAGFVLAPILAVPALLASFLSGLVIVETIFAFPGWGRLLFESAVSLDYGVVLAITFIGTVASILTYFLCHALYGLIAAALGIKPEAYLISTNYQLDGIAEQQIFSEPHTIEPLPKSLPLMGTIVAGLAGIILLGILVICLSASSDDALKINPADHLLPRGSEGHPLGTDELGRDVQTRLWVGGRESLRVAFYAALISMAMGVVPGLIGGVTDGIIGNILNIPMNWVLALLNGIPFFMLVLLILIVRQADEPLRLSVVLGLLGWANIPPMSRAWLRAMRRRKLYRKGVGYVLMSFALLLGFLLVNLMGFMLLMESTFGFLGIGIQPPTPTWGNMLSNAMANLQQAPHLMTIPASMLMLTLLCLAIIAQRLRDSFDFTAPDVGQTKPSASSHLDATPPETYNAPITEGI